MDDIQFRQLHQDLVELRDDHLPRFVRDHYRQFRLNQYLDHIEIADRFIEWAHSFAEGGLDGVRAALDRYFQIYPPARSAQKTQGQSTRDDTEGWRGRKRKEEKYRYQRQLNRLHNRYIDLIISEAIIDKLCSAGGVFVGYRHPNPTQLKERWQFSKEIIQAVVLVDNHTIVAGYNIVYPLSAAGCKALDDGTAPHGGHLKIGEDICSSFATACGVYVAMTLGNRDYPGTRGYMLRLLQMKVAECSGVQEDPAVPVYARPHTSDAYRLARRHGFVQINSESGLYRRGHSHNNG